MQFWAKTAAIGPKARAADGLSSTQAKADFETLGEAFSLTVVTLGSGDVGALIPAPLRRASTRAALDPRERTSSTGVGGTRPS